MSHPLIHSYEHYVVLEPGEKEKFLTTLETIEWLEGWLRRIDTLPKDLANQSSINSAAKRLLDTSCDLEIEHGFTIQWFAVRLDPE